jgi:hypothetical protein
MIVCAACGHPEWCHDRRGCWDEASACDCEAFVPEYEEKEDARG